MKKDDCYYPRLAGLLRAKLELLAYGPEIGDLLRDRSDWETVKAICDRKVAEALEAAERDEIGAKA